MSVVLISHSKLQIMCSNQLFLWAVDAKKPRGAENKLTVEQLYCLCKKFVHLKGKEIQTEQNTLFLDIILLFDSGNNQKSAQEDQ